MVGFYPGWRAAGGWCGGAAWPWQPTPEMKTNETQQQSENGDGEVFSIFWPMADMMQCAAADSGPTLTPLSLLSPPPPP